MNTEKLDQNIKINLFSTNPEKVVAAVHRIKEIGNKKYLPILLDVLLSHPEEEVEKEIRNVLDTVKLKDTVPVFIDALLNEKYAPVKKILLTACWQNGLDFSNYLPVFIDIVIADDWETSFEAFTVIDNMENTPDPETLEISLTKINKALETSTGNNKYFLQEILTKLGK